MTISDLLDGCDVEHFPREGDPTRRAFVCPKCGKPADLGPTLDDSNQVCLTCLGCKPGGGVIRFTEEAFLERYGAGTHAAPVLLDKTPAPIPPPSNWREMERHVGPIEFEWEDWLPRQLLTMIVSASGVGKSFLALRIADCFLRGSPWPDGSEFTGETGNVLWCESEAAQALNLDRAKQIGLPLEKMMTPLPDPLDSVNFNDSAHRVAIANAAAYPETKLIVVDSLSGGIRSDENASRMIEYVMFFAGICRDTETPTIVLHHLRKTGVADPDPAYGISLDRIRGSSTIVQPVRVLWALDLPGGPGSDVRRLSQVKNSLRRFPDDIGMVISDDGIDFAEAPETVDESKLGQAKAFLRDLLHRQPKPAAQILQAAEMEGIAKNTLDRAKRSLRITSVKSEGRWFWTLPAPTHEGEG